MTPERMNVFFSILHLLLRDRAIHAQSTKGERSPCDRADRERTTSVFITKRDRRGEIDSRS